MEKHIEVHFLNVNASLQEIFIAQLADAGYEGFEQGLDFLKAFIAETNFNESVLHEIANPITYSMQVRTVEPQNWNEEWERSFTPVIIEDFCAIRASFHPPVPNVEHQIIITPKMSFGTGHHATTSQVIQLMGKINFQNKDVFDFGTGTGVLAILAEKLGARDVLAIDNDAWSIRNAQENIEANLCHKITLQPGEGTPTNRNFDVILANINRHVITQELSRMAKQLRKGGVLVLSGLLKEDQPFLLGIASNEQLIVQLQSEKHEWIALSFTKC